MYDIIKDFGFKNKNIIINRYFLSDIDTFNEENYFLFVIDDKLNFWAIGDNANGQLGLGTNAKVDSECLVEELCGKNIVSISVGAGCFFAHLISGEVYTFGSNLCGEPGRPMNERTIYFRPEKLVMPDDPGKSMEVISIKYGYFHNAVLTKSGKVYLMGFYDDYIKSEEYLTVPIQINPPDIIIKAIYCYRYNTFMISENNEVYFRGFLETISMDRKGFALCEKLPFKALSLVCDDKKIYFLTKNDDDTYFLDYYLLEDICRVMNSNSEILRSPYQFICGDPICYTCEDIFHMSILTLLRHINYQIEENASFLIERYITDTSANNHSTYAYDLGNRGKYHNILNRVISDRLNLFAMVKDDPLIPKNILSDEVVALEEMAIESD